MILPDWYRQGLQSARDHVYHEGPKPNLIDFYTRLMSMLLHDALMFQTEMDLLYDMTLSLLNDTSMIFYSTYEEMERQRSQWMRFVHLTCRKMLYPLGRKTLSDLNLPDLVRTLDESFPYRSSALPSVMSRLNAYRTDASVSFELPPSWVDTVRHQYLSNLKRPRNLAELEREKAVCHQIAPDLCETMLALVFRKCEFYWDADYLEMLAHLCVTKDRTDTVLSKMQPVRLPLEEVNRKYPHMMAAVARAPAFARTAEQCVQPQATGDELFQAVDRGTVHPVVARRCFEEMADTDLFEHRMTRCLEERLVARQEAQHLVAFVAQLMPCVFKGNYMRMAAAEQDLERHGVLVARGWSQHLQECAVPKELERFVPSDKYRSAHPDRKLHVSMRVGRVLVQVRGVRVRCPPVAAVALMRMRENMTVEELMRAAECDVHVVFSLVHPKNGLLQKNPNTSVMERSHRLRFHPKLNSVLPTAGTRKLVLYRCKNGRKDGTADARMLAERQFRTLQSHLVRLFKTHKQLDHAAVLEAVPQFPGGVEHSAATIKRAVETLIEQDYLERHSESRSTYLYVQ